MCQACDAPIPYGNGKMFFESDVCLVSRETGIIDDRSRQVDYMALPVVDTPLSRDDMGNSLSDATCRREELKLKLKR